MNASQKSGYNAAQEFLLRLGLCAEPGLLATPVIQAPGRQMNHEAVRHSLCHF
jgi:hypothetical protein